MEHQDWLCNIIDQHIKFHPSDDLWTFLTPLILIWHPTHYDSHSLEAVSLLIESSDQIKLSFHLYSIFPTMSHCVSSNILAKLDAEIAWMGARVPNNVYVRAVTICVQRVKKDEV